MECKQACLLEEDLPVGCQFETTFALDSSEAGWDLNKSWSFHVFFSLSLFFFFFLGGGGLSRTSYVLQVFFNWFSQKVF